MTLTFRCRRMSPLPFLATPFLAMLFSATLISAPVLADRVVLRNGRVLEGSARELPGGEVEISSSMGVLRISGSLVERVENSETLDEQILQLADQPGQTPESLFRLALEARDGGSVTLSRRLLYRILEIDPDHEPTRQRLGFRYHQGRWVAVEDWYRLNGLVPFRGEWIEAAERTRILYLEAAGRQIAEQRRLESERHARWLQAQESQMQQAQPQAGPGIPIGYVWGTVAPHAVPPVAIPPGARQQPLPKTPVRVTPPSTAPQRQPTQAPPLVPGRAATGRFQRGG